MYQGKFDKIYSGMNHDRNNNRPGAGLFLPIIIIVLYLQIELWIPYGPYLVSGVLAALLRPATKSEYLAVAALVLLGTLSVSLSDLPGATSQEVLGRIRSLGIYFLSIMAGFGTYLVARERDVEKLHRFFKLLSLIIFSGALLENLGLIRDLSNSFRSYVFTSEILYVNDLRDIQQYGFIRPKLFTSEPSHLAKFLGLFLYLAALTAKSRSPLNMLTLIAILSMFAVQSAALLPGALMTIIHPFLFARNKYPRLFSSMLMLLVVAVSAAFIIGPEAVGRLGLDGTALEPSAYLRLVRPMQVAYHVLQERPLFGSGLGAEASLHNFIIAALSADNVPWFVRNQSVGSFVFGNIHFALILQFGVLGTLLFIVLLSRLVGRLAGDHRTQFFLFFVLYGATVGSVNTPILWGPVFLVLATLRASEASITAQPEMD